jgi:hypothetical protein
MEAKYLDNGHILALRTLFHNFSIEALGTMQTLTIANEEVTKLPPLTTLTVFRSLTQLNIRNCKLKAVPAGSILQAFPLLTHVDLSSNSLTSVMSVLPLGELKHLTHLNLLRNPLALLGHRINLIQAIVYPEHKQHFKVSKCLSASYMNIPRTANYSTARTTRTFQRVVRKAAPVPREGSFPMLQVLCEEDLMDDEMTSAKPYDDEVLLTPAKTFSKSPLMTRHRAKNEEILSNRAKFHPDFMKTSSHPCLNRKQNIESIPRFLRIEAVVVKSSGFSLSESASSEGEDDESFTDVLKLYNTKPTTSKPVLEQPKQEASFGYEAMRKDSLKANEVSMESAELVKKKISFTELPSKAPLVRASSGQARKRSTARSSILETMAKDNDNPPEIPKTAFANVVVEDKKKTPLEELKHCLETVRLEQVKLKKEMEFQSSKKLKFDQVASQLYGPDHHLTTSQVDRVGAILRLINKGGVGSLATDQEIRLLLANGQLDEGRKELAEGVLDLNADLVAMHYKPESLEHWMAYVERRQLELAEHNAIIALHKKKVFGDIRQKARDRANRKLAKWQDEFIGKEAAPLAGIVPQTYVPKETNKKAMSAICNMAEQFKRKQGKAVMAVPQYLPKVDYKGVLKECYPDIQDRMDAPRPLLRPMQHLEAVIKQHQEKMRNLEHEFESLSAEDKLIAKVGLIKQNIANRERSRGVIEASLTQLRQMTESFFAHQKEYYASPRGEGNRESEEDKKIRRKFKQRKDFLLFTGSRNTIQM